MGIVFINGCFDILHVGHIRMFKYAKSLGSKLIVAIDSDDRVKSSKGQLRPFTCLADRIEMLKSIKHIDDVLFFSSDFELEEIIKKINPDFMVIGSDWKGKTVIGEKYAKELKFFRRIDGYSTTKIFEDITNR